MYNETNNHELMKSYLYIVFFSSCTACDSWECVLEEYMILGASKNEPAIHKTYRN